MYKLDIVDLQRHPSNSAGLVTVSALAAGLLGVALALAAGCWEKLLGGLLLLVSATVLRQGILVEATFLKN